MLASNETFIIFSFPWCFRISILSFKKGENKKLKKDYLSELLSESL